MFLQSISRIALAGLVLAAGLRAAPLAPTRAAFALGLPFEKIAQDFLARHGLKDTPRDKVELDAVLASHFVHGRLGQFEVYFPVSGLERRADDLKAASLALLQAQEQWLGWIKPLGHDQKSLRKDLDTFANWVGKWNPGVLARAHDAAGQDLLALMSISDSVAAASQRFADSMGRCAPLGAPREEVLVTKILLIPDRRSFVELACFVGWLDPGLQKVFWVENVAEWTQCFYGEYQIIALEYASAGRPAGDYERGTSMNERDALVMEQQVVQLAMNSLFDQQYGERVPKAFIGGLSMNLVIDQFDNISTKIDGDLRERSTQAREVFVPGGASSGGFLPPQSAETRWREDRGRDHFVRMLKLTQKEGDGLEKKAKNRFACFAIRADNGGTKMPMIAPFLGSVAVEAKPPPDEFRGEFMEFLRAYKCGFIYWLQNKAAGSEKASHELFAQLLQRMADAKKAGDFEAVFRDVYDGASLSDLEAGKTTLEGKFLIWLAKQKDSN